MSIQSLITTVTGFAPELGIALAGPAGGVVGSLIASVFGGNHNDPEDVLKKINADPEAALKLKTLEFQNQQALAQINATNYATEVNDREDARKLATVAPDARVFMKNMTYVVTVGFFIVLFILFCPLVNLNNDEKQMLSIIVGMLVGKWQTIVDFWFGSAHKQFEINK